jgi:hypothetical protein
MTNLISIPFSLICIKLKATFIGSAGMGPPNKNSVRQDSLRSVTFILYISFRYL